MGVLRIFGCWLRFSRFAIFKVGVDISMSHPMCITNVTFFSSMLSCPFPPLSIAKVQGPSTLPRAVAPEGLKPWWGRTKGQLISKANCQAVNSSKKQTNESVLLLCDVFLFVFWKKLRTSKNLLKLPDLYVLSTS